MTTAPASPPTIDDDPRARWRTIPAWVLSCVVHCLLFLSMGLVYRSMPQGAAAERLRPVGIVLRQVEADGQEQIFDETNFPTESKDSQPQLVESESPTVAEALSDAPSASPASALPTEEPLGIGIGLPGSTGVGSATGLTEGAGGPTRNVPGGKASTSVFGVKGEGYRFVYVFDRSGSMGGSGRSPLVAAKEQMLASLDSLTDTHQFQIVFYNQDPHTFNPAGKGRLAFASTRSKELAKRYIGGVQADGSTNHELALRQALSMGPDCIFFLTDADDPMSPGKVADIRRRNGGQVSINTIEFGVGPPLEGDNFLRQLARENGGNYGYVDITMLRGAP